MERLKENMWEGIQRKLVWQ